jgi:hypothetical protein
MAFNIVYSIILLGGIMSNIFTIPLGLLINTRVIFGNFYNEFHFIKNNALRIILSDELNRTKLKYGVIKRVIRRNIKNKYNKVLSRCYDLNYDYNSLTYAEKTLLEVIVSLTY